MKSGWKTTEFWLGLLALLLPFLGQLADLPFIADNAVAAAVFAGVYAIARALPKAKKAHGDAIVEEAKVLMKGPQVEKP